MSDDRPEFAYIDWIRSRSRPRPHVSLGIGDDAAAVRFSSRDDCLVTVDMLMEGVDFHIPDADPHAIGRKALAVNLSDIAAMAGRPLAAFVSAAFPRRLGRPFAEQMHDGLERLATEFDVAIAGGDTNAWDGPFVISVTVLGEPTGTGPVRRSGACPGDWIFVTGALGGSISGKHLTFDPRVREALALHQSVALHAMIDISDGLAADLHHLLDESAVGATLFADAIPISDAARELADGKSPLDHAFGDGEDFELLFTVSADDGRRLLAKPPFPTSLRHIGEITGGRNRQIVDSTGGHAALPRTGWSHEF